MSTLEIILAIAAILIFAVMAYFKIRQAKQIDAEGIETDAVVSRIERQTDADGNFDGYATYVSYTDENGQKRESFLASETQTSFQKGMQLRIKYLPGNYKMVREAR